jgi:hypothetical protein
VKRSVESATPEATDFDKKIVIRGLGGVGKTVLASRYMAALLDDDGKATPGDLRRRIAGLDQLHGDLASWNVRLPVVLQDCWQALQVLESGVPYSGGQALLAAQPLVGWYTGGAIPTNTAGQGPGKVVFTQPEAALACAPGRGRGGGWRRRCSCGRPGAAS